MSLQSKVYMQVLEKTLVRKFKARPKLKDWFLKLGGEFIQWKLPRFDRKLMPHNVKPWEHVLGA